MIDPRTEVWQKNGSAATAGVGPEPIPDTIAEPPPSREHLRQILFPAREQEKKKAATDRPLV